MLKHNLRTACRWLWCVLVLWPTTAWAGMASPLPTDVVRALRLTDSTQARIEAVSFFLAVLLLAAVVVRWLWNRLGQDFPRLPRLSYIRSLAVVALWGLLFLVVLTMIAATREMMTPGVWQKQGLLYTLAKEPPPAAARPAAEPTVHLQSKEKQP